MEYKLNIILNKDKHGYYAYCPDLPGCHSQGDTFKQTLENIREAATLYVETMSAEEISEAMSKEVLTTTMNIKVA